MDSNNDRNSNGSEDSTLREIPITPPNQIIKNSKISTPKRPQITKKYDFSINENVKRILLFEDDDIVYQVKKRKKNNSVTKPLTSKERLRRL